jgi:hypothetical protein
MIKTTKSKIIALIIAIMLSIAMLAGITACSNADGTADEIPTDGNYATIVLKDYETDNLGTMTTYGRDSTGWSTIAGNSGYGLTDLIGTNVSFGNYGAIRLNWKTDKYKITKVEFNAVAETTDIELNFSITGGASVGITYYIKHQDETITTTEKHYSYEISATNVNDYFGISFQRKTVTNTTVYLKFKITNLKITAEKV